MYNQTPKYYLQYVFPYPIIKEKSKAKFDPDKGILKLEIPVIKKTVLDL